MRLERSTIAVVHALSTIVLLSVLIAATLAIVLAGESSFGDLGSWRWFRAPLT